MFLFSVLTHLWLLVTSQFFPMGEKNLYFA
jgi:hypothetical protein